MKTKQIILTIAFLFATLLISAQDKYEFMVIEYNTINGTRKLTVSIDGEKYSAQDVEVAKTEKEGNANPFLKKVKEYQSNSWEVMNLNCQMAGTSGYTRDEVYFAYLRKKKTD